MGWLPALTATLISSHALAFEIHPVSMLGGAYGDGASATVLLFQPDSEARQCHNFLYPRTTKNQGVHEVITRNAYRMAYGKALNSASWVSPLLNGVQWNDDPEELTRKAWFYNGTGMLIIFGRHVDDASRPNTLTRRTHYGDLSFLHAMRGLGETEQYTKDRMYRWLKYTYEVALGNVPPNTIRKYSPYHEFFAQVGCSGNPQLDDPENCTVMDVFDMKHMFRDDEPYNLKRLATGAIAHLIQDSFSEGHTVREPGSRRLLSLKSYDKVNQETHCELDGAYEKNRGAIINATQATARFLIKVKSKSSWCETEPLFDELFDFGSIKECTGVGCCLGANPTVVNTESPPVL